MKLIWAIAFCACCSTAFAQETFQNLNFEAANIIPISGQPHDVTAANALPGWTVDYGGFQQTQVVYNEESGGGTTVTVLANGYPTLTTFTPIDGNFSVILYAGVYRNEAAAATISQTGQIPIGTQSLLFDVALGSGPFVPEASIGSEVLSLFPVGSGTGENAQAYTTWGANVSAWAGQTEELSLTSPVGTGALEFDDISFSPNSITTPEPDALPLMVIGSSLFAAYRRFVLKRT